MMDTTTSNSTKVNAAWVGSRFTAGFFLKAEGMARKKKPFPSLKCNNVLREGRESCHENVTIAIDGSVLI